MHSCLRIHTILSLEMHKHAVLPPIPHKWALCFDIINRIDVMVCSEGWTFNDLSEWSIQHSNQWPTLQVDGKKTQATLQKKKIQRMEAGILQYGRLLEPHPWQVPPHQCEKFEILTPACMERSPWYSLKFYLCAIPVGWLCVDSYMKPQVQDLKYNIWLSTVVMASQVSIHSS